MNTGGDKSSPFEVMGHRFSASNEKCSVLASKSIS